MLTQGVGINTDTPSRLNKKRSRSESMGTPARAPMGFFLWKSLIGFGCVQASSATFKTKNALIRRGNGQATPRKIGEKFCFLESERYPENLSFGVLWLYKAKLPVLNDWYDRIDLYDNKKPLLIINGMKKPRPDLSIKARKYGTNKNAKKISI